MHSTVQVHPGLHVVQRATGRYAGRASPAPRRKNQRGRVRRQARDRADLAGRQGQVQARGEKRKGRGHLSGRRDTGDTRRTRSTKTRLGPQIHRRFSLLQLHFYFCQRNAIIT